MSTTETPQRPVRLAVLDDHELLLDSLASWIHSNASDFDLVLRAQTWLELVHSDEFPTDLVFLDFQLQESVSIEARVRTCRAAGAKVIVLSSLDTRESRERALASGAEAFLAKSLPMTEVMDAARAVMGTAHASRASAPQRTTAAGSPGPQPGLSQGEEIALSLYATGLSTQEVADRMNVKYETAKTYLRRVREKYARVGRPAGKKSELIRRAAEDGYLK